MSNTDEHQSLNENSNELTDRINLKRNQSWDFEIKEWSNSSDKDSKFPLNSSNWKRFGDSKKLISKYFTNNYDGLLNNGPIFEVKKVKRWTAKSRLISNSNKKRKRNEEPSPCRALSQIQITSQFIENSKESLQQKAFKITKNIEKVKEGLLSKEYPDYDTDVEKNIKETLSKLAKDGLPSAGTSPEGSSDNLFSTQKIRENSKEDNKIVENQSVFAMNSAKKESKKAAKEKLNNENFKDLLFDSSDAVKRQKECMKGKNPLKKGSIKLLSLSS
jgi:hypothetical protein